MYVFYQIINYCATVLGRFYAQLLLENVTECGSAKSRRKTSNEQEFEIGITHVAWRKLPTFLQFMREMAQNDFIFGP